MTAEVKIRLTAFSVALAFLIQLGGSVWFLSGLSEAVRLHSQQIVALQAMNEKFIPMLYQNDAVKDKIARIEGDLKEIKYDLKELVKK